MMPAITAPSAPRPVGNYPHARRVGNLLFLSGVGPRDPATNEVPGNEVYADGRVRRYDIAAQTHAVLANVRAVLQASGAQWDDLVDVTVYLTDMLADFRVYNAIWAEYFPDAATAPCRTTVGITALPTAIAIELKCTAVLKD
jgi:2-aminomuconate deaminase